MIYVGNATGTEDVFSDLALAQAQLSEALDLTKQLLKLSVRSYNVISICSGMHLSPMILRLPPMQVSQQGESISELVRRVQHLEDALQQQKSENNVIRLQNQNLRVLLT